jgi:pyridoxal phosphate enzyme (YggS family)
MVGMTSPITLQLMENLKRVRDQIHAACERSRRSASDVTMVAVTKYAELDWVRALVDLGVRDLGESRPQQLAARAAELPQDIHWHLIGHLQRNKVDQVLPVAHAIHSVDSVRLLEAIDLAASKRSLRPRILLEVNVSGEQSKDGFDPDSLRAAWPDICQRESVDIRGLMTMAPLSDDPESARAVFARLRDLRAELALSAGCELSELSMGMSGDFEVGIEQGATLVRIGSRLFEGLASAH